MLESQNVKASYHPMSIRFFFINSTPICRGGGLFPDSFTTGDVHAVLPMGYNPGNEEPPEVTGWPAKKEIWQLFCAL